MLQSRQRTLFSSASDRWATPAELKNALYTEFCLNFDACPLDGISDGLAPLFVSWYGKRVSCNPPYGPGIQDWLLRGFEAEIAVYLLPARTDTKWFHGLCLPKAKEIRFVKGRLKFGNAVNGAPFPSMIVIFEAAVHADGPSMRDESASHMS